MKAIEVTNIAKSFNNIDYIIKKFSYSFTPSFVYCLTGNNGSGKSTLLKMLALLSQPTSGSIFYNNINSTETGFVAPYMNLYEDLTVLEMCDFHNSVKSNIIITNELYEKFEIDTLKSKTIQSLSSGQKQRVKLFLAAYSSPEILFFDEPSTNLDNNGFKIIERIIEDYKQSDKILIIASNFSNEIDLSNVQIPIS